MEKLNITYEIEGEKETLYSLLAKYGNFENLPLRCVVELCKQHEVHIEGLGNGKVKLVRDDQ
jgi:hypothetical protein